MTASALAVHAGASSSAAAVSTMGSYHPVPPKRILDTPAVAANADAVLQVAGIAQVPSSGVAAIALNVTVVAPQAAGYLTVYPDDGSPTPNASNVNFGRGQTVANLVVVRVATDGKIRILNASAGRTRLLADVSGYFSSLGAPAGPAGSYRSPRRGCSTLATGRAGPKGQ